MTVGATRRIAIGTNVGGGAVAASSAAVLAFAVVLGLAAAQGGYFPTAWGWASVPLLAAVAVTLALRSELDLTRSERFFLGALAALTAWTTASTIWSVAPAETVLEVERLLLYVAAAAAALIVGRSSSEQLVPAALLTAIALICSFALATRLLPDRIGVYDTSGGYRLSQPIGYWNGLGLFAAMGVLLALGFAARARTTTPRAACGALLVVLLPTVYFTFSRGAWIALVAGLVVAVAVDPRRLQLLATVIVLGLAPVLAVVLAWREPGLTHTQTSLVHAAHAGHHVAVAVLALAAANAGLAAALARAERRLRVPAVGRALFGGVVTAAVLVVLIGGLVRYGGPAHIVKRVYTSFKSPPPQTGSLNKHLLNLSGTHRADLWRLAWDDSAHHRLLGAGAGTYERYFLAHQPPAIEQVRDAHNLYLETLAELGPIGLALLLAFLLSPLPALRHARHRPLLPLVFGAYVAYLVHVSADWDWELPAVTLVALYCMATIVRSGSADDAPLPVRSTLRWSIGGLAVAASLFATITLIGNAALAGSGAALQRGNVTSAAVDARRARVLLPWSPLPLDALGRAQLQAGLVAEARRSFRRATSQDPGDWQLWYDLAGTTTGAEHSRSLAHVAALYPRSGLVGSPG